MLKEKCKAEDINCPGDALYAGYCGRCYQRVKNKSKRRNSPKKNYVQN